MGLPNTVPKNWGTEEWIVNSTLYCLKRLVVDPGCVCSVHRHPVKEETFYVDRGHGFVEVGIHTHSVAPGSVVQIPRGMWHRFGSHGGMVLLEVSTHHSDEDVVRREGQPSRAIREGEWEAYR